MCTSTLMFVLNTTQALFVLKPIHTIRQQASGTSCHTPSGDTLCHKCSGHGVQASDSAEKRVHSHEAVLSQYACYLITAHVPVSSIATGHTCTHTGEGPSPGIWVL